MNQLTHKSQQMFQNTEKKLNQTKVLIVEDDITSEPIWEYIVSKVGKSIRVDRATGVDEASCYLNCSIETNQPYQLVISDIFLSGPKTGIDLWHDYHTVLSERIILTSSISYSKMHKHLGRFEVAPLFLQKPLIFHDCIEAVYGILHR